MSVIDLLEQDLSLTTTEKFDLEKSLKKLCRDYHAGYTKECFPVLLRILNEKNLRILRKEV